MSLRGSLGLTAELRWPRRGHAAFWICAALRYIFCRVSGYPRLVFLQESFFPSILHIAFASCECLWHDDRCNLYRSPRNWTGVSVLVHVQTHLVISYNPFDQFAALFLPGTFLVVFTASLLIISSLLTLWMLPLWRPLRHFRTVGFLSQGDAEFVGSWAWRATGIAQISQGILGFCGWNVLVVLVLLTRQQSMKSMWHFSEVCHNRINLCHKRCVWQLLGLIFSTCFVDFRKQRDTSEAPTTEVTSVEPWVERKTRLRVSGHLNPAVSLAFGLFGPQARQRPRSLGGRAKHRENSWSVHPFWGQGRCTGAGSGNTWCCRRRFLWFPSSMKLYQLASVGRSQLGWQHARVCGFWCRSSCQQ